MTDQHPPTGGATATCHCGAVTVSLAMPPAEVTERDCSLRRKSGVTWAHLSAGEATVSPDPPPPDTCAWNGRHVDLHRCRTCGCVTSWLPRDLTRDRRGGHHRGHGAGGRPAGARPPGG